MNRELITCDAFEEMLLAGIDQFGTTAEKKQLNEHLIACPACVRLQQEIAEYKIALSKTEIKPNPDILHSLKNHLSQQEVSQNSFRHIFSFFNQPVPRYQTLLAAGLAFIIFLFTYQNLPYIGTRTLPDNSVMKIKEEIYNYENRAVSNWILSESQKVGISISEDSLFNSSFYRAM